jgi:uncharacterized protein YcfL
MINRIKNKFFRELNNFKIIILRKFYLSKINNFDKIILILVPNDNQINGGVMSIASIYKELTLLKSLHSCNVVACTNEYNSQEFFIKFNKFENEMLVFDINSIIKKLKNTNFLQLHIPELYLQSFLDSFSNKWSNSDKEIIKNIKNFQVNILNQNDLLMPENKIIEQIKINLTQNLTMTVAHKKYATIEKKLQYNIPVHYLSAWLNPKPYDFKKFNEKENIIVFSPDELSRLNIDYHFTKNDLIKTLNKQFPDFEIIVIEKMTYDNYKKLVSKCKFMITFGEGLDAYLLETILSGGISFAIYNEIFFNQEFKNLPTIYKTVDDLFKKIVGDIVFYNNSSKFDNYNHEMKLICEKDYSYEKYQYRVKNFVLKNYDFK